MVRIIVSEKVITEKKLGNIAEKKRKEEVKPKEKTKESNTFKKVKVQKQKKFLKKPKAKGPAPISARKTLRGFAHSAGPMVREVERQEPVQDNRSQFFNSELETERRGINQWLG